MKMTVPKVEGFEVKVWDEGRNWRNCPQNLFNPGVCDTLDKVSNNVDP